MEALQWVQGVYRDCWTGPFWEGGRKDMIEMKQGLPVGWMRGYLEFFELT